MLDVLCSRLQPQLIGISSKVANDDKEILSYFFSCSHEEKAACLQRFLL